MFSLPKLFALGVLSLATLVSAAPSRLMGKDLVTRTDDKKTWYDYDVDFKDIKVEVVIIEVEKKDFVCILIEDPKDPKHEEVKEPWKEPQTHKRTYDEWKEPEHKEPKHYDDCKPDEFILCIKEYEYLCKEVEFCDWKDFEFPYVKKDDDCKDCGEEWHPEDPYKEHGKEEKH